MELVLDNSSIVALHYSGLLRSLFFRFYAHVFYLQGRRKGFCHSEEVAMDIFEILFWLALELPSFPRSLGVFMDQL